MKFKTYLLLLFAFLLMAAQCEKEKQDPNTLPPETQEGKNTFGCLINGELFTGFSKPVQLGLPPLTAYYSRSIKVLSISAAKQEGTLGLKIKNPQEGIAATINSAGFAPRNDVNSCFYYAGKDVGMITLTKFDTINLIVSGRFSFSGQCSDSFFNFVGDSTVHFTDGRFDIKLNMAN